VVSGDCGTDVGACIAAPGCGTVVVAGVVGTVVADCSAFPGAGAGPDVGVGEPELPVLDSEDGVSDVVVGSVEDGTGVVVDGLTDGATYGSVCDVSTLGGGVAAGCSSGLRYVCNRYVASHATTRMKVDVRIRPPKSRDGSQSR
jgi:hypothetical protein